MAGSTEPGGWLTDGTSFRLFKKAASEKATASGLGHLPYAALQIAGTCIVMYLTMLSLACLQSCLATY